VRSRALAVYALLFVTEVTWLALVPLAPRFAEELGLSKLETGSVLAAAGIATVAVAVPVGLLADRFGARALTLASGGLLVLSALGQAAAPDYVSLLAARVVFGVAMGGIWTAGLALLSTSSTSQGRTVALGSTITAAAAASVIGPALVGLMSDELGLGAPFVVLAVAAALATIAVAPFQGGARQLAEQRRPLREVAAVGARERFVLAAVLLMTLLGIVNGGVNLLVPLELRANGLSSGEIGLAFSVSSAVFLLGTVVVTRLAGRAAKLSVAGVAAAVYAGMLVLAITSAATPIVLLFVVLRAPAWAVVSTLPYPLGAMGAERAGLGHGAVIGFLNLAWGCSNAVGPLLAGAVAQGAGPQLGFLPGLLVCAAAAWWLVAARPTAREEVAIESAGRPLGGQSGGGAGG
jgi:predicted MFS family arabinose efflux permease